eukprot:scaffold524625_cov38-Prasinocladus_malaysianus.AAC.1
MLRIFLICIDGLVDARCQSKRVPYEYEYADVTEVSIQQQYEYSYRSRYEYNTQDESWLMRRQLGGSRDARTEEPSQGSPRLSPHVKVVAL